MLFCAISLTGCGKETEKTVLSKLSKKIDKVSGYKLEAEMELINNEDSYKYDISVSYKEKHYYSPNIIISFIIQLQKIKHFLLWYKIFIIRIITTIIFNTI